MKAPYLILMIRIFLLSAFFSQSEVLLLCVGRYRRLCFVGRTVYAGLSYMAKRAKHGQDSDQGPTERGRKKRGKRTKKERRERSMKKRF